MSTRAQGQGEASENGVDQSSPVYPVLVNLPLPLSIFTTSSSSCLVHENEKGKGKSERAGGFCHPDTA
jgi:hypothetical protein